MPLLNFINNLSLLDGRQVSLLAKKIPDVLIFRPENKNVFFKMHSTRWESAYALETYSYFDDGIYSPQEFSIILQNRLLPKMFREAINDYLMRLLVAAVWSRESKAIVNRLVDSLFQVKPTRNVPDYITEWTKNVDGYGTRLSTYVRRSETKALLYGQNYTLIELPKRDLSGLSFSEQQKAISPRLTMFNALEIINWKYDDNCELLEAVFIKSTYNDDGNKVWRWYFATRESIKIYEKTMEDTGEDPKLIHTAEHDYGFVPVVVHYGVEMYEPMMGASFIQDTVELDIAKLRRDSAVLYSAERSAYNQLVVWTNEQTFGEIKAKDDGYLQLRPDSDEKIEYLQYDTKPIDINMQISQNILKNIRSTLGVDPNSVENESGKLNVSGISRQLSYMQSEKRKLVAMADRIEEFETALLRMVNRIMTLEDDETISVCYPDEFSLQSADAVMETYREYKDIIPVEAAPAWHKTMMEEVAKATIGENEELIKEIEEQLDSYFDEMEDLKELARAGLTREQTDAVIAKHGIVNEDMVPDEMIEKEPEETKEPEDATDKQ